MKKLFPDAPDVPQHVANRAVRVVEKHLRVHKVNRVRDLPEEAKVRLYRDLRFFFEGDKQSPGAGSEGKRFSIKRFFSRLWEGIEDFLSASESNRANGEMTVFAWAFFGETAKCVIMPPNSGPAACDES